MQPTKHRNVLTPARRQTGLDAQNEGEPMEGGETAARVSACWLFPVLPLHLSRVWEMVWLAVAAGKLHLVAGAHTGGCARRCDGLARRRAWHCR